MHMIFFEPIFDDAFLFIIIKITLAMLLGLLLGLERVYAHKTAGMRTYALVSMASAFFVIIAQSVAETFAPSQVSADAVLRMASQIIVGVGFLGTGLIIFKDGHIENLTTAAGMWASAGIGMAVGFGLFKESLFVTFLTFFVLGILSVVERYVRLQIFPDPLLASDIQEKPKRTRKKKNEEKTGL